MFIGRNRPETRLEMALEKALDELSNHAVDSDEYAKVLERVVKLHKMKEEERPDSVSRDTQAMIAANLTGILLIISYEHLHPITSKALSFVARVR